MGSSSSLEGTPGQRDLDGGALLLEGALVQRADTHASGAILKVREPGRTTFVVISGGRVAITPSRVPRLPDMRHTAALEGHRIAWINARCVALHRQDPAQPSGSRRARI